MRHALGTTAGAVVALAVMLGLPMAAGAQEAVAAPGGKVVARIDGTELPGYLAEKQDYDRIYAVVDGIAIGREEERVLVARYIRHGMLLPGGLDDTRPIKSLPGAFTVVTGAWMPTSPDPNGGCNVVVMFFNPRNGAALEYEPGKTIRCNPEDPAPPPPPVVAPQPPPEPPAAPAAEPAAAASVAEPAPAAQ